MISILITVISCIEAKIRKVESRTKDFDLFLPKRSNFATFVAKIQKKLKKSLLSKKKIIYPLNFELFQLTFNFVRSYRLRLDR